MTMKFIGVSTLCEGKDARFEVLSHLIEGAE